MTAPTAACCLLVLAGAACTPKEPNELDRLRRVQITIKQQNFDLWVAEDERTRLRGLMFITAEQMKPLKDGTRRGMIFVFPYAQQSGFWMKNTVIPLDIAYLTLEGEVVSTYTMTPLDDRPGRYLPARPYRFAIEVPAGTWNALDLKPGDKIAIPPDLLKRGPSAVESP